MDEVCPNCGKFVDSDLLVEETGWCPECSLSQGVYFIDSESEVNLYQRTELYLRAHADEIEHHLLNGKTVNQAIDLIHSENGRPKCLVCGEVMSRARRNSVFCRRTPQCRKTSRRYVYLYTQRGMTKAEALALILEELT